MPSLLVPTGRDTSTSEVAVIMPVWNQAWCPLQWLVSNNFGEEGARNLKKETTKTASLCFSFQSTDDLWMCLVTLKEHEATGRVYNSLPLWVRDIEIDVM